MGQTRIRVFSHSTLPPFLNFSHSKLGLDLFPLRPNQRTSLKQNWLLSTNLLFHAFSGGRDVNELKKKVFLPVCWFWGKPKDLTHQRRGDHVYKALKARCFLMNSCKEIVYVWSVFAMCRVCLKKVSTKRTKLLQVSETEKEQSSIQTFTQVPVSLCFFSWQEVCFPSLTEHTSASDDKVRASLASI